MKGLVVNNHLWQHLSSNNGFDACVDHISITNIVKAKTLPTSQRIIRLLDLLSKFKFSLYISEVIPISFDCLTILTGHFNQFHNKFLIATRRTTKELGMKLLEGHGISKILSPYNKPEHQKPGYIIPQKSHPTPWSGQQSEIPVPQK